MGNFEVPRRSAREDANALNGAILDNPERRTPQKEIVAKVRRRDPLTLVSYFEETPDLELLLYKNFLFITIPI